MVTYRVELANKTRNGRAVGNLYLVARLIDGRRGSTIAEFETDEEARAYIAQLED